MGTSTLLSNVDQSDIVATLIVSSISIVCSCLLMGSFFKLRYKSRHASSSQKAGDACTRSSGPLARLVIIKASCDLAVAVKFFLASLAGGVPAGSFWCYLEYFVGQCIALMSCAFNFLICLALYLIFKREAMSPQTEVEAIVSKKVGS